MGKFILNGIEYAGGGGGGGGSIVYKTKAEYDILPQSAKMQDVLYLVDDTIPETDWTYVGTSTPTSFENWTYPSSFLKKIIIFTSYNGTLEAGLVYDHTTITSRVATVDEMQRAAISLSLILGSATTTLYDSNPKQPELAWNDGYGNYTSIWLQDHDSYCSYRTGVGSTPLYFYYTLGNANRRSIYYHDMKFSEYVSTEVTS